MVSLKDTQVVAEGKRSGGENTTKKVTLMSGRRHILENDDY